MPLRTAPVIRYLGLLDRTTLPSVAALALHAALAGCSSDEFGMLPQWPREVVQVGDHKRCSESHQPRIVKTRANQGQGAPGEPVMHA